MKTYTISTPFRPVALQEELTAAGVGVLTVRAVRTPFLNPVASSGEVVTDDAAVDATVNAVIAAHVGTQGAQDAADNLRERAAAKDTVVSSTLSLGKALRATGGVQVDEINILRQQIIGRVTVTIDPPNLPAGTGLTKADITVTGAAFGDAVDVLAPYSLLGVTATGYIHAADTVGVRLQNGTTGAVNLASGDWVVVVRRQVVMPDRTLAQYKTAVGNKIDGGTVD